MIPNSRTEWYYHRMIPNSRTEWYHQLHRNRQEDSVRKDGIECFYEAIKNPYISSFHTLGINFGIKVSIKIRENRLVSKILSHIFFASQLAFFFYFH